MKYSAIHQIDKELFSKQDMTLKEDSFAKTYLAKSNAMKLWQRGFHFAVTQNEKILSSCCFTISKTNPKVANLQLLHTFSKYRRQGYAKSLLLSVYNKIVTETDAKYFRVSSEFESVEFYRKLGFKFCGVQKSGSFLCVHKINKTIKDADYTVDSYINNSMNSNKRGSLVKKFEELL